MVCGLSVCVFFCRCRIETSVEEKASKWQSGGSAKLDLVLDYTPLDPIDEENMEAEGDKAIGQIRGGKNALSTNICVLLVCVGQMVWKERGPGKCVESMGFHSMVLEFPASSRFSQNLICHGLKC